MTDAPPTELNTFDYGFQSNHWMLKAALAYVPQRQLHFAFVALIDWLVYKVDENPNIVDLMDVIAQAAFTGRYVPTTDDAPSRHDSHEHHDEMSGAGATIESAPTGEVDEKAVQAFTQWLDTLPTIADEDRNTHKEDNPA